MSTYPAIFEPADEGGFIITFPDFGWGVSQGDDEQDAMQMATDLLATLIGEHVRKNIDLPKPSKRRSRNVRRISLRALDSAKAELYTAFRQTGFGKAELARRVGIAKSNVDRLFDLEHASRLEQIEAAFQAIGKRLTIDVEDAA